MRREATIRWHGDTETYNVTVAIEDEWKDGIDDENVFWYFLDWDEYKDALENGTPEFSIIDNEDYDKEEVWE